MSDQQISGEAAAAQLAERLNNPEFVKAYLAGNGPNVREVRTLMEAKNADPASAGDRLDKIIAGTAKVEIGETTTGNEISTFKAMSAAAGLREVGLNDAQIKQVLAGKPVPKAEYDLVKTMRDDRTGNAEWTAKYLKGDHQARREMTLMNAVIAAGFIEEARP